MKSNDRVIGIRETVKMLKQDRVDRVILAEDAEDELKEGLLYLCEEKSIPVRQVESRVFLGQISGIERPATVVAFLKA